MADRTLEDYASGDYVSFKVANPIKAIYKSYKWEKDPFNEGKERIVYTLEVDGEEKLLTSQSKRLARQFISVAEGDAITILRTGEGFKTDYQVLEDKDVKKK